MALLDLVPVWLKVAVGVALVAGVGIAIYQWREDIKQGAYDAIFKKQVEAAIEENRKDFQRQLDVEKEKTASLLSQIEAQKQIAADLDKLRQAFMAQKFANAPIDPGLKYAFDQIRASEAARKAKMDPTQKAKNPTGNTTLDNWKKGQSK